MAGKKDKAPELTEIDVSTFDDMSNEERFALLILTIQELQEYVRYLEAKHHRSRKKEKKQESDMSVSFIT